jgi:mitochondrial import inner membrane translocase subunit TIM23
MTIPKAAIRQSRFLNTSAASRAAQSSYTQFQAIKSPRINLRAVPNRSLTTTAPTASSAVTTQPLDWNTYLGLRKKRRYYNLGASIITGFTTFATGASLLMSQDIEQLSNMMFGLDPIFAMGIVCIGFGAAGWLIGPFAGGSIFKLSYRRVIKQMELVSFKNDIFFLLCKFISKL